MTPNASIAEVVDTYSLTTHPLEGYWRAPVNGKHLWLLPADLFIPWFCCGVDVGWRVLAGSPCTIARSENFKTARAVVIGEGFAATTSIPAGCAQTPCAVGLWTLLEGTLPPDYPITERRDAPDDWFPGPNSSAGWADRI